MKIIFLLITLMLIACQQKTYEDCVLEQMKNGNSDTAARIISHACEEKYGLPAYKKREKEDALQAPEAEAAPAEATAIDGNGDKVIGLESELYPEKYGQIKKDWLKVQNDTRYITANEDKKIIIRSAFFNEEIEPFMKVRNVKDSLIEQHRIEFIRATFK